MKQIWLIPRAAYILGKKKFEFNCQTGDTGGQKPAQLSEVPARKAQGERQCSSRW